MYFLTLIIEDMGNCLPPKWLLPRLCGRKDKRIRRLATRLVTGIRHLPYKERLKRVGLHYLQRQRLGVDLITAFGIFTGLLSVGPSLIILPLQGALTCEPSPKERVGLF